MAASQTIAPSRSPRPHPSGKLVRRARLVDRLMAAREATLALIVAPPGYGKSTLLGQWEECDEREFVWLNHADLERTGQTGLPDGLGEHDQRSVVVIDHADRLPRRRLRSGLAWLLEELPESSLLAIASRREPPLPVGRLRAHRALVEVRMGDLAMTVPEAGSLLRRA